MLYVLLLAVLIGLDQWLKYWTVSHLVLEEPKDFIPGVVELWHRQNDGAGWSILSGKTAVLLVVTIVLMLGVVILLIKKIVRHPMGVTACTLILGGGIGNMIDRIRQGYVVDMLHFQFMPSFPIFNLADCFVVVGAILGAVYYLWLYDKVDKKEKPHASDADGNN